MSKNQRDHIERELDRVRVERERASIDVATILADFESPDPVVRAAALRRVCPCHVPQEVFEQIRKPAQRLRRDPDPVVRGLAVHLEDDARELNEMAARLEQMRDRDDAQRDYARSRPRSRRRIV